MSSILVEPVLLTKFFTALSNRIRLQILQTISANRRPFHIKALSRYLRVDYASIYRHIALLKDAGLVDVYDVGRSRVVLVREEETVRQLYVLAASICMT